jgi:hypothetical protein
LVTNDAIKLELFELLKDSEEFEKVPNTEFFNL